MQARTKNNSQVFEAFLILASVLLVLSVIVVIPVYSMVIKISNEIIKTFLDIPTKKIKAIFIKCENFVNNI